MNVTQTGLRSPNVGMLGSMVRPSAGAWLFSLATTAIVVIVMSNVLDGFYPRAHTFKPLYLQFIAVGLAGTALVTRATEIVRLFPNAILVWMGLYLGIQLVSFLLSAQTEPSIHQLTVGIKTAALFFAFTVLLLLETDIKWIPRALVAVALVAVAINLYDFANPTFSTTAGRSAGFYQNANFSGKSLSFLMVLSCLAVPKHLRLVYCLGIGLGVLVTFSRSSWLMWAIGLAGLAATGRVFLRSRSAAVLLFGGIGVLTIFALLSGFILSLFHALGIDQYLTGGTIARLGGGAGTFSDASAAGRIEVIWHSLSEFQKNPWFGAGLGATSEWITLHRPHNTYLLVAVEAGTVGLLVFLSLIAILWRHADSVGKVAVILFAVSSFFSHTNLEQAAMLLVLAVIIVFYRADRQPAFLRDRPAEAIW